MKSFGKTFMKLLRKQTHFFEDFNEEDQKVFLDIFESTAEASYRGEREIELPRISQKVHHALTHQDYEFEFHIYQLEGEKPRLSWSTGCPHDFVWYDDLVFEK